MRKMLTVYSTTKDDALILRYKYRYILFMSSSELDFGIEERGLLNEIMRYIGEISYSKANPKIAAQYSRKLFVIKTERSYEDLIILALSFIKELHGRRIGFFSLKSSGTIKSLRVYSKKITA
jgi:RNase P/RNase MRP subunit POP5